MVAFFSKMLVGAALLMTADSVAPKSATPEMAAKPAAATAKLRGVNATSVEIPHSFIGGGAKGKMPCQCIANDPAWKPCARTVPRCVFIDLGAANGNTFEHFMKDGYGPVANCPSGQWHAIIVEANPRFNTELAAVAAKHPNQLEVKSSTAAYMCEAHTSFYVDTVNTAKNFWGSSMSSNHPDVVASGKQKVTVPTVNINKIIYEETIPGDWVMLKMDIEGSEFDVLPCTAQSPAASLIDRLYLEQHSPSWGMAGTTPAQMEAAKNTLRSKGVDIPDYFSQTL